MRSTRALARVLVLTALALALAPRVDAQFFGHNFAGDYGLFSGSRDLIGSATVDLSSYRLEAPVIEYLSDATYRSTGYIQLSVATRDTHSYINTFDFFHDSYQSTFNKLIDIFLINKRHLDVNLSKLRLSIGTKIFIPKTTGNLEITLHA